MRAQHIGVVVARGIGLGLIVFGISSAVTSNLFVPSAASGWTSYSPAGTATLHDAYFAVAHDWLPCLVQVVLGAGLILFSKPIGRWLAMGLKDDDSES